MLTRSWKIAAEETAEWVDFVGKKKSQFGVVAKAPELRKAQLQSCLIYEAINKNPA